MTLSRKFAGLGAALAVAALLWGSVAASASAQFALPSVIFGLNGTPGDLIEVSIDGVVCDDSGVVDADGAWSVQLAPGGACNASDGDEIQLWVNGELANETVTFVTGEIAGGVDEDLGLDLTIADGTTDPAPDPADTGNAGLMGSAGTSMALVLALGVFAAALVAGGRTAVRRS